MKACAYRAKLSGATCRERITRLNQDVFLISMAARTLGLHPQTLRKYERLGLVQPTRAVGSMRLYSSEEIERLRLIKRLVDELGVNLAGVQQLLLIAEVVERIRPLVEDDRPSGSARRKALRRELDQLSRLLGM